MTNHSDLIEALEAATEGSRELDAKIYCTVHGFEYVERHSSDERYFKYRSKGEVIVGYITREKRFSRSTDAALTLVPEMREYQLEYFQHANGDFVYYANFLGGRRASTVSTTLPLAICVAAFRAMEQKPKLPYSDFVDHLKELKGDE